MSDDVLDLFVDTADNGRDSPPQIPMDSPGSSASSRLKDEYSQLLKYTIESTPGLNTIIPLLQTTDKNQTGHSAEPEGNTNVNNLHSNSSQDLDTEKPPGRRPCMRSDRGCNGKADFDSKLCGWLGELKENILGELEATLEAARQTQHETHLKANEQILAEKASLEKEVNQLTEQMNNLEHKLQQKCTLIKNLTDSLVAQKKKVEVAKHFYHWKADHYDKQREIFTEKLAVQHHERKLNLRVLKSWYGVIQTRWRNRTERKSQTQAKEMCLSLSSDYETKVGVLNEKIAALEKKVSLLQAEREMYSEQVKKAFMRGMCALNMETMSVFGEDQLKQSQESTIDIREVSTLDTNTLVSTEEMDSQSKLYAAVLDTARSTSSTSRQEHKSPSQLPLSPSGHEASVQSLNAPLSCCASSKLKVTRSKTKPSKSQSSNNNKVVGSTQVLAPPMASVVVERHPPVNKQTMGKATAVRFPKKNSESVPVQYSTTSCSKTRFAGESRFKPLAGQKDDRNDNRLLVTHSNIKVVD